MVDQDFRKRLQLGMALLLLPGVVTLVMSACSGGGDDGPTAQNTSVPRETTTVPRTASSPRASIEPRTGPPGTQVTVTGSGWPAGAKVDLTGMLPAGVSAPPYTSVTADDSGSFTARFRLETAPDGGELRVGRFDLIARSASIQVDIPFQVETRRPITGPGPGG